MKKVILTLALMLAASAANAATCESANSWYSAHSTPGYAPMIAATRFSDFVKGPSPVIGGYTEDKTVWFGDLCAGSATGAAGTQPDQYTPVLECPDGTTSETVEQVINSTPGRIDSRKLVLCIAITK